MTVELRRVDEETAGDRFDAYMADGRRLALLRAAKSDRELRTLIFPDPRENYEIEDMRQLLNQLMAHARSEGAESLSIRSPSVLVRQLARRAGFEGSLRGPLISSVEDSTHEPPVARDGSNPDWRYDADLTRVMTGFGVPATAQAQPNSLARMARRMSTGVSASIEMNIEWRPGHSFRLTVPDRADLLEEGIARCADTAVSILRRFALPAALVRDIYFDRSDTGLIDGTQAGHARETMNAIHLNVGYCAAYASLQLRQRVKAATTSRPYSGSANLPYTTVDAVTAHELWHLMEQYFEATHYSLNLGLKYALGEELGVETLEHAIKGNRPSAPEPWRQARIRIVEEVSPYAATKVGEATAEMFKAWWCRTGTVSPIGARFGEFIEEHFSSAVN